MSQQVIDIGSSPNSGNGNPLRTAWTKANANFTELYNGAVGLATDVLYVSKSGNDSNTGLTLSAAFLTVNRAVQAGNLLVAVTPTARVCIFVKSGSYTESNPVTLLALTYKTAPALPQLVLECESTVHWPLAPALW